MAKKSTAKGKTGKRKISGSKGKVAARQSRKETDPRGVIGLIVLCLGILALVCQFVPSSGNLLNACKYLVRGLGGTLCLLLPLVIIFTGGCLVFFKENRISLRTMICVGLIFIFVEGVLQLFEVNGIISTLSADGRAIRYGSFLSRSYAYSSYDCMGGGLIGALIAWPLFCAVDVWGGVLLLFCAVLVALMVLTGLTFTSVGMALSEWFDDLRVELAERREEREAMREMEEEKRLNEERERAEQQKKRREEREAQRKREEQAPQRQPEEAEAPKAKKTKKKTAPVQSQEETAEKKQTPGRASPFYEDGVLYIERDDEFIRESIEARPEYRDHERAGESFTIEEAEEAFLYGMNAPRKRRTKAQAQQQAQAQEPETEPVVPAKEEPALSESEQAAAYTDEWSESERVELGFDEQFAAEWKEAELEMEAQQEEEEPVVFDELPARVAAQRPSREASGSAPSFAADGVRRAPQQKPAEAEEKTIVQLRENRMDGTPLVMPKKDTHESPKVEGPEYVYPPLDLLNEAIGKKDPNRLAKIEAGQARLLATLKSFHVEAKPLGYTDGPAITRYELEPAPGVRVSKFTGLEDDIALRMAVKGVRIEAPIPGMPAVGIEIPKSKKDREMVSLRDILESQEMKREESPTAVALGKDISGRPIVADLAEMVHVLVAGTTGSGKSVCINTIITSIIYRTSPREVRLIMIDPKVVELSGYDGIPHLLIPVVTEPKKAAAALSWAVVEMEHRYKRFAAMGVNSIRDYNDVIGSDEEPMSNIVVIIDELNDLMMVARSEVEDSILRLAQKARAAGIHLVVATQRPTTDVITGTIKANIPSRIAFAVKSNVDSRTILDATGAESLLGKGDMLYLPHGENDPTRVQGCFVSSKEVQRVVNFVRGKHEAEYNEEVMEQLDAVVMEREENTAAGEASSSAEPVDELLAKAIELAVEAGQVSISMLQRRLRVGYARAGRLVDEMTLRGIVGEADGPTKPRTVLITKEEWRRMQENQE